MEPVRDEAGGRPAPATLPTPPAPVGAPLRSKAGTRSRRHGHHAGSGERDDRTAAQGQTRGDPTSAPSGGQGLEVCPADPSLGTGGSAYGASGRFGPRGEATAAKVTETLSVEEHRLAAGVPGTDAMTFTLTTRNSHSPSSSPKQRSRERVTLHEDRHHSRENLHIRNVPLSMDERTLRTVFSQFGSITSAVVMRNIHTGESLGKAFVRFDTEAEASRAMEALNGAAAAAGGSGRGARRGGAAGGREQGNVVPAADLVFIDEKGSRMTAQWARKQHDSAPVGVERRKMRKLFVRNIPTNVSSEMLETLFKQFGTVSTVSIHHDTRAAMDIAPRHHTSGSASPVGNGRTSSGATPVVDEERRIAFITYTEEGVAAEAALQVHNTTPFASCCGVPLMVKLAEDTPLRHGTNATGITSSGTNNQLANTKSDAGRGTGGSGYTSLSTTFSQLPSASSPVRPSSAVFPGQTGMMSLAGLSQQTGAFGGAPIGPSAMSSLHGSGFGREGSPVLAHTMNSTSSLGGTGFMPSAGPRPYSASGSPGYRHGSSSAPFAYVQRDGSPRFGTPAVGGAFVPAVSLPSASAASSGAGRWVAGTAHGGPTPTPPQTLNGSPFYSSLTGAAVGGSATPVMTASYNALPLRSAAASGMGSPIGASLFNGTGSPSGRPPSASPVIGIGAGAVAAGSGMQFPLHMSSSAAGGAGVAPQVFIPAPMYPSSVTIGPGHIQEASARPFAPTSQGPALPPHPSAMMHRGIDTNQCVMASSPWVEGPLYGPGSPSSGVPQVPGQLNQFNQGVMPDESAGELNHDVLMSFTKSLAYASEHHTPACVAPSPGGIRDQQSSLAGDRSSASGSGISAGRLSRPRKHSATTSEESSTFSNSLRGGGGALGPVGPEETSGLTMSQCRNAMLDETSNITGSTSPEITPSKAMTGDGSGTSVAASTGVVSTQVPSSLPSKPHAQQGVQRPTISLEAVRPGTAALFDGDFNVFTPVAGSGSTGVRREEARVGARRQLGGPDSYATNPTQTQATHSAPYHQFYGPSLLGADTDLHLSVFETEPANASGDAHSLQPQSSLHSFMNEAALQQLMSQLAPPSEDNEFLPTPTTPAPEAT